MELPANQSEINNFLSSFFPNMRKPQAFTIMDIFKKIAPSDILTKDNPLYNQIQLETRNIYLYLDESIKKFHLLLNSNLKDFDDCLRCIESISIPNKCVCAGSIDKIPGWRCVECSKYANTIYCNDCYLKSKHLHRNHTIQFLYSANGMCDCGDPDSLYVYCPEHSGPFKTQEQINDYISKIFSKEVLDKLNDFFGNLFLTFSKYLILTEKCEYFYSDSFEEKFKTKDSILNEEKEDIILLKNNFIVVFQNLMNFLRLISEKNIGMLHLIADYFLKNHFKNKKIRIYI